MKRVILYVMVAAIVALGSVGTAAAVGGPFRVVQNETFLVIFSGGSPVLQYRHDGSLY